jgi:hypothetical protein
LISCTLSFLSFLWQLHQGPLPIWILHSTLAFNFGEFPLFWFSLLLSVILWTTAKTWWWARDSLCLPPGWIHLSFSGALSQRHIIDY